MSWTHEKPVDETELISAFESGRLPAGSFHHADHVRLAFAYLRRYDLFETLARYREGLKRFAARAGVPEKYHETVTCALVILIHERMALDPDAGWEDFVRAHSDLLDWKGGAFFDYYPAEVLTSELARRTFVLPHPFGARRAAVEVP